MTRSRFLFSLAAALLSYGAPVHAQLVQSTFATDANGWLNVTLPYPTAVPPTVLATYAPTWVAVSGGYIRLNDPDGSGQTGECQYWAAPAAFLGDQSVAFGGTLAFDLANSGSGYGPFLQEDVILTGAGLTLIHSLAPVPVASFTHYSVVLAPSGWKKGGIAGPTPTIAEMRSVLAAVNHLYIRAEHQLGPDVEFLDNVVLSAGNVGIEANAPPRRLSIVSPTPNPSFGAVQIQFASPRAGDGVVQVIDASGREVVALSRGEYAAGTHIMSWDGRDDAGRAVPAGLYWIRVSIGSEFATRAVVRVR